MMSSVVFLKIVLAIGFETAILDMAMMLFVTNPMSSFDVSVEIRAKRKPSLACLATERLGMCLHMSTSTGQYR
jgi:hypothetical protein